jgi:eukaryotic-like serine/threonine-protein kinase
MADLRVALGQALGPAYRVEREVRPVGNCRMFVALDQAAGTERLVKVLPTPLSLGVDHERFGAELVSLGARLAHRGLVAPDGGGRAGSFVYHTRRFVQGTTLRATLARHGELPLRRAVEVLHDILEALAHAHGVGIWHGDLKPENVLLADGQTLVTDAGVFSAVERSCGQGATTTALCTTEYLAPERRAGGARAGSRDDVFAVGVMLHEMLTGHPPAERGEPLESLRSVPAWLGELGRRCRAAEPTERWSDAAAALAGGSWPGGAGGGVAE